MARALLIATGWDMAFSSPTLELRLYLQRCVREIQTSDVDIPSWWTHSIGGYTEHPATSSGRALRCLARLKSTETVAVLFYGYAGPNGVLSVALGLQARELSGFGLAQLVTAEAHRER